MTDLLAGRTSQTTAETARPTGHAAELDQPAAIGEAPAQAGMDILREITRGGLAGLIVGVLVAGVGGRVVMRLAALLVPQATGSFTENGNVIGAITLPGTIALIVFVGLFVGAAAGSIWVTIQPWMPVRPVPRIVLSSVIALGLGINGLIEDRNPDFAILDHAPAVVGSLVVLVALVGPALVVADRWLEGRLPQAGRAGAGVRATYAIVTAVGLLLTGAMVVPGLLNSDLALSASALIVVGVCTLASWWRRSRALGATPMPLTVIARAGLTVATVAGLSVAASEIAGALGPG